MVCIYVSMRQLLWFFFAPFLVNYQAEWVRLTPKLPNFYLHQKQARVFFGLI